MRALPPVGLLLDVDGPVASPETRRVPEASVEALVNLARHGVPVVFNTGRSAQFVLHQLIAPLRAAGLPPQARFHGVCEKGAVVFSVSQVPDGALPEVTAAAGAPPWVRVDDDMRVPADLASRLARLVTEEYAETMFHDDTKLAMFSAEMNIGESPERYRPAKERFEAESGQYVDEAGVAEAFRIDPTIISSDVEHVRSGKDLGAQRSLELLTADGELPVQWYTCGDSRSDYAMADWLHRRGAQVTHVDVRPEDGVPATDHPVLTPADLAAEGYGRPDDVHERAGLSLLQRVLYAIEQDRSST